MKILYYNLLFGSFDGSSMHAKGLLEAIEKIIGKKNVMVANDYKNKSYCHSMSQLKRKISKIIRPLIVIRREFISRINAIRVMERVKDSGFNPEYILARSVLYDATPILIARMLKCKLIIEHNTPLSYEVCELQNLDSPSYVEKFEKEILEKADLVYVVSNVLKSMLTTKYSNLEESKMLSIPNGYMKNIYDDVKINKLIIRKEVRSNNEVNNKKVVTFIGSLKKWHGINNFLLTAKSLCNNGNIEFWIVGDGEERDLVIEYLRKYNNLKWFRNVPMTKLRNLLWASDLGIMPYEQIEKFYFSPLKMFDMLGAELPFIGVDIGQIHEVVKEHLTTNFLVKNNNFDILVEAIIRIFDNDEIYNEMKNKVIEVRDKFSWDSTANYLLDFIKSNE